MVMALRSHSCRMSINIAFFFEKMSPQEARKFLLWSQILTEVLKLRKKDGEIKRLRKKKGCNNSVKRIITVNDLMAVTVVCLIVLPPRQWLNSDLLCLCVFVAAREQLRRSRHSRTFLVESGTGELWSELQTGRAVHACAHVTERHTNTDRETPHVGLWYRCFCPLTPQAVCEEMTLLISDLWPSDRYVIFPRIIPPCSSCAVLLSLSRTLSQFIGLLENGLNESQCTTNTLNVIVPPGFKSSKWMYVIPFQQFNIAYCTKT